VTTTATVKRALAALAARTDIEREPYAAVIDEAEAALADLDRAAGFVDSVGLDRLSAATDAADRAGDIDAAERGAAALDAYRRYRRAAAGDVGSESTKPGRGKDTEEHGTPEDHGVSG